MWIHKTRAITAMHAYRRERERTTHWHKKLRPFCEVFWRSVGSEKGEGAATCAEKAIQADPIKYCLYQDEKPFLLLVAFPLEGSKTCAMCNDLCIETSFIPCAPAVIQINSFF